MPAQSGATLTRLQTTQHKTRLYLVVYQPRAVWAARVNGDHALGATDISVQDIVDSAGRNRPNFQVLLGRTAGGGQRGTARYRSLSGATLSIAPNNMTLRDNDYITILEEVKPSTLLPKIQANFTVLEDGIKTYTDETTNYKPLANFGPPAVAWLDPASGQAIVKFYASADAFATGATISSYDWAFPGAASASSTSIAGSAGSPIDVVWTSAGQHYVRLTVTDSNGKVHRAFRPVFILDRNNRSLYYDDLEVSSLEGDVDAGGWSCHVKVSGAATKDDFPGQALCVLFADDWYGDEYISLGGDYRHRENIVFVGYIRNNTTRKDWKRSSVDFQIDGIGRLMDNLLAWPANLKDATSPTKWHELSGMTAKRIVHHIITEHSTLAEIADVEFDLKADYSLKYLDLTESTLKDQVGEQCLTAIRAKIGSSRTGRIVTSSYPQLFPRAQRTEPTILTASYDDMREEIDFGQEDHERKVAQVDFISFYYSGSDPKAYYSLAPGVQWVHGRVEKVDGIRADSQAETNQLAGIWEGWLNADFKEVTVKWRGNYRIFDVFPFERVKLTIAASQNNRGVNWVRRPFWIKRVSMSYKPGILLVDTVLEKDVGGKLGITNDSEVWGEDPDNPGSPPPPDFPTDPPDGVTIPPPAAPGIQPPWYQTYDVGGGYPGSFTTISQNVGVLNSANWSRYFVEMTGSASWNMQINGSTIVSGSGSGSGGLGSGIAVPAHARFQFNITAGSGSDLWYGIGV